MPLTHQPADHMCACVRTFLLRQHCRLLRAGPSLSALQAKIAQQVQRKYGVTDEQVMAAVEHYNARNDPAFKEVLEQIARTLMMQ